MRDWVDTEIGRDTETWYRVVDNSQWCEDPCNNSSRSGTVWWRTLWNLRPSSRERGSGRPQDAGRKEPYIRSSLTMRHHQGKVRSNSIGTKWKMCIFKTNITVVLQHERESLIHHYKNQANEAQHFPVQFPTPNPILRSNLPCLESIVNDGGFEHVSEDVEIRRGCRGR